MGTIEKQELTRESLILTGLLLLSNIETDREKEGRVIIY